MIMKKIDASIPKFVSAISPRDSLKFLEESPLINFPTNPDENWIIS